MPVAMESANVKASTGPLRPMSPMRGNLSAKNLSSSSMPKCAAMRPSAPPHSEIIRDSLSSCWIMRERFAPRAERMAISLRRANVRARIEMATRCV